MISLSVKQLNCFIAHLTNILAKITAVIYNQQNCKQVLMFEKYIKMTR